MNGKIGDLRPSQFITTFGPGAVMDLPDFSVIVAGIDKWDTALCQPIYEPRLARKLGVKKILSPPIPASENNQGTMPAYRFPRFLVCPECRKLGDVRRFHIPDPKTQVAYCSCNKAKPVRVFPARFVVACPKGHISDFPWHRYVHANKRNYDCRGDLYLNDRGVTGSIADVEVECKACSERRTLEDAFQENRPDIVGTCSGNRPWLGGRSAREECGGQVKPMLRGASNAYFAMVESALSIPPYTNPIHEQVSGAMERLEKIDSLAKLQVVLELGTLPEFEGFDPEKLWEALVQQRELPAGARVDILHPEWEALIRGSSPGGQQEFETQVQAIPPSYEKWISKLVMVRRLVEVRVLKGFTRIDPPADTTDSGDEEISVISSMAPLSRQSLNWLPGLQTRGEGIFIALNEKTLAAWEDRDEVKLAAAAMARALEEYSKDREIPEELRPSFPGARYVLLHTLAHVLMRQLCLDSGYSSTSLRERIYCRAKEGEEMAGILIYTATPDSEGSLGGLVELGRTPKFEAVLWGALKEAMLCSGDPLCSEHKPEAVGDLNGAACHACALAPETSCERSNRFLDRSFLVPTVSGSDLAYFK